MTVASANDVSVTKIVRDYGGLIDALVARRHELALSCMALDARAGFHEGYSNKLENWDKPYGRGIGPLSLGLWLESLGLVLHVVQIGEGKPVKHTDDADQMSLDLVGGRMNTLLPRKGFKRFCGPTLVDLAA
jgi:hypothetical protein